MRKQRLGRLKEIRERKNLSQKELAQRLSISQTYISKLERGEIAPSRKMIDELAYVLEVSETSLAVPSSDDQRTTPRAASLFDRTLKVFDRGVQHYGRALVVSSHALSLARSRGRQALSAKDRSQLASAKNLQDRDALVKEFVRMLSPHERHADGANAIALCGSHGGLPALDPDNPDHAMIAAAIGRYLARSNRTFTHIVRQVPSTRADDGANALVSGMELSMHFHCLDSQGIAPGKDKSAQQLYDRLPSRYLYLVLDQGERQDLSPDIYMVPDAGSLIAFPSPVHSAIENGLFIDGQEASCRSYLEFVAGVGRRPIEVFGPNVRDSERFQRQASRGVNRRYALYQGFLSAITRPVLHFRPGTPWWVRNAKRYATIQTIADYRRDRYHRVFSDNVDEIQFRQICSRDALEKWAETGKRTDLDAVDPREPDKAERLERVDTTIKILERFDGFELTILDRSTWNKQQQGNVSWSVSDGNRIDFERGFVETDDLYRSLEQRSPSGDWKVRLTVEDRAMGDVFEGAFDRFWSEAAGDGTSISNRRDVLNYLHSLRAKINGN